MSSNNIVGTSDACNTFFFILDNSKVNNVPPPKVVPNILRKRLTFNPSIHFSNKKPQEQASEVIEAPIPTNQVLLDSGEDCQTFVLDQNEFASLPLQLIENTARNASTNGNVDEIVITEDEVHVLDKPAKPIARNATINRNVDEIVITEDEVHVLDKPTKPVEGTLRIPNETQNSQAVCRTCLSPTPLSKCSKLFEGKIGDCLRKKILYVAGFIDFLASNDPVVCSKCVTLIDIAYTFKKKLGVIESMIQEESTKLNNKSVDLFSLTGTKNVNGDNQNKDASVTRNEGIDLSANDNINGGNNQGNNSQNENIIDLTLDDDNDTNKTTQKEEESLEQYLAKRDSFLQKFFSGDLYTNHLNRPKYPKRNSDIPNPTVCSNNTETNASKILSVQRLKRTSLPTNLFSNVRFKAIRENRNLYRKWVVTKDDGVVRPVNAAGRSSDEVVSAATVPVADETPSVYEEAPPTIDETVSGNDKIANIYRTYPAIAPAKVGDQKDCLPFQFVFNRSRRRKKPPVPKTFNLFDEEHDRYFQELEGNAGCKMVRKWFRFSKKPPQIGDGPFLCELCGNVFESRSNFQRHTYTHTRSIPYMMCYHCGDFFKGNQKLKDHIMTKHKPPSHKCKFCGKMFHITRQLSFHVKNMHTNAHRTSQCHHCGKIVKYKYFRLHLERHTKGSFPCPVCNKVFASRISMYHHKIKHFKRFHCQKCPANYSSDTALRHHVKHDHEGIRWKCTICYKLFAKKENLIRHYRGVHCGKPWKKRTTRTATTQQAILQVEETVNNIEQMLGHENSNMSGHEEVVESENEIFQNTGDETVMFEDSSMDVSEEVVEYDTEDVL